MNNPKLYVPAGIEGGVALGEAREASVGERLNWEKCGTCGGRGFWTEWQQTTEVDGKQTYHDCPDCYEGWVPPAELVEQARGLAHSILLLNDDPHEAAELATRAVLLEQARWIGEQQE